MATMSFDQVGCWADRACGRKRSIPPKKNGQRSVIFFFFMFSINIDQAANRLGGTRVDRKMLNGCNDGVIQVMHGHYGPLHAKRDGPVVDETGIDNLIFPADQKSLRSRSSFQQAAQLKTPVE